jgi:hypothetical protein
MKFLKLYSDSFSTYVNRPKDKVVLDIAENVRKRKESFFLRNIRRQKFSFSNDVLEIELYGSFFNPYGATGNIKFIFAVDPKTDKTKLECQLISIPRQAYPGVIILLSVFTLAGLFISRNSNTILAIIIGWVAFLTLIHFCYKWKLIQLKSYANAFIVTNI